MHDVPPTIDEIVVGDDPASWVAAGFTVDADGVARIGTVRVRLVGAQGVRGIQSWSLRGVEASDGMIDDIATSLGTEPLAVPADHPNGVSRIDHVVLLSSDGERTAAAITAATGLTVKRIRETSSYGAPMRQWFFRLGEVILELVAPDEPDGSVTRFFGLAFVADLDVTVSALGERVGSPKDAVQPGRRITSLRHKDIGISVPIAFMSA